MMAYVVIDGGRMEVRRAATISLDLLQGCVGGYIESIQRYRSDGGRHLSMLGNEDAIRLGLAPNVSVPGVMALGGFVRGPVVIVGVDKSGNETGMTTRELERVRLVQEAGDPVPRLRIAEL